MKPIKLTICGWGSYPDEVTIDFTNFYRENLFLITGPTGSGKTTIFDAVSYALFGDVSGKVREKSSVRSDFSMPQTDTYVLLRFSHKGENYNIKRAPKYMRPKKRGDGFTTSSEMAELYFEKEPPITDISGVNLKITELLGMNYEQFKQTSMIAQGEFMELLISGSKDKVEIFRNLFKTEKYNKLQHMLSEKSKLLSIQIENLTSKMEEAIHGIDSGCNRELMDMLGEDYLSYTGILNKTKELIKEDKVDILIWEKQIGELEDAIKKKVAFITEGEHNNEILSNLKRMEHKWEELLAQKSHIEDLEKKLENAAHALIVKTEEKRYLDAAAYSNRIAEQKIQYNREIENADIELLKWEKERKTIDDIQTIILELQKESQLLQSYLPMIMEWKEANEKLNQTQLKVKEQEKKNLILIDTEKGYKEESEQLKKEFQSFLFLEKETAQHQLTLNLVLEEHKKVKEALRESENNRSLIEELERCQKAYKRGEKELGIARESYREKETAYRNAQVGLVARFVEEGKPCPVCGSLEHPKVAQIKEEVPDEKELEQLKKKLENKETEFKGIYQKTVEKKAESDSRARVLEEAMLQIGLKTKDLDRKEIKCLLLDKEENVKKELERLFLIEKEDIKKAEEKEKIQNRITSLEVSYKEYLLEKEENLNLLHVLTEKYAGMKGSMEQLLGKLPESFTKDKEDVKEKLKMVTEEIQKQSKKIDWIQKNYQRANSNSENWKVLYKKNQEDLIQAQEEEEIRKEIYKKVRMENGFLTEEQYNLAVKSQQEIDTGSRELKAYEESCQFVQATKDSLKSQIGGKPFVKVEELREQLSLLEEERKIKSQKKEITSARVAGNERIVESVLNKTKDMEKLQKEYGVMKELDDVSKGNNKERIVFEHYVLASYFEDILYSANKHLFTMTGSRYELMKIDKVADARTKDSLDIEVLDYYTGKKRSVKSLSGGESFKAALSLALGLSDVVQRTAGGIQIDTLFIDEGFGSLDTESLEQAMDTITSLTEHNRLIGIISHVSELKERFSNQIVVEKGRKGSKLCEIH